MWNMRLLRCLPVREVQDYEEAVLNPAEPQA